MEKGRYGTGQSFIRFGKGEETLVIFPPLVDALFEVERFSAYLRFLFFGLSRKYTVHVIGRRRGLPIGTLTRDMARDYAEIFKTLGPSHVLGVSLGGLIAQYFAADHPQYVKRLILIANAHRMGPEGIEAGRQWIPWARNGRWEEIYDSNEGLSYHRPAGLIFMKTLKLSMMGSLKRQIKSPDDFIISGEAAILHDAAGVLSAIGAPTLILGGENDRIFPQDLVREMSRGIRNSELHIVPRARHALYEEHTWQVDRAILDFLRARDIFHGGA